LFQILACLLAKTLARSPPSENQHARQDGSNGDNAFASDGFFQTNAGKC